MNEEAEKSPVDFADELLQLWARDFMDSEKYRKWGMTYTDAIAQALQWNAGAAKNIGIIKQFHNLLGLAIEYLEKK